MSADTGFRSFGEFYPFYLGERGNRTCRRLHFAGTSIAVACAGYGGSDAGVVAGCGGACAGLRVRLDRPFLFQARQTGDVQVSAVQLHGRLASVVDILNGKQRI